MRFSRPSKGAGSVSTTARLGGKPSVFYRLEDHPRTRIVLVYKTFGLPTPSIHGLFWLINGG